MSAALLGHPGAAPMRAMGAAGGYIKLRTGTADLLCSEDRLRAVDALLPSTTWVTCSSLGQRPHWLLERLPTRVECGRRRAHHWIGHHEHAAGPGE
jgi:hypothetical protein